MNPQKFLYQILIIYSFVASLFPILRAICTPSEVEPLVSESTQEPTSLDCSAYTWNASSKNKTIQRMNFAARLHACFEANSYDISQLPVPPLNEDQMKSAESEKRQQVSPILEIDYHFGVIYVIEFAHGEISLLGGTSLSWTDGYRAWNKLQIPIDYMQLRLGELWYPQLLFVSTVRKRALKLFEPDDMAQIYSDGYVSVIRRNVLEGHCDVNYLKFPFDRQICQLQFSLERYFEHFFKPGFDVKLVPRNESEAGLFEWFENDEWELIKVTQETRNYTYQKIQQNNQQLEIKFSGNETFMTGFEVNITLQRYPHFYVVNILIPILVLSVMGQTAFAVPENEDAKIVVPLTVLLGFMFVQGIVANELPRSAEYPLLAMYILACEVLTGLNCIMCSICMWLALNGLRVSPRVARIIQRVSSVLQLRRLPSAFSHSLNSHSNDKTASAEDSPSAPPSNFLHDSSPKSALQPTTSDEAVYHVQPQELHHQCELSPECTCEKRFLPMPNAMETGDTLARLLNRVLSVIHFTAITLLFVSLICFPLILFK